MGTSDKQAMAVCVDMRREQPAYKCATREKEKESDKRNTEEGEGYRRVDIVQMLQTEANFKSVQNRRTKRYDEENSCDTAQKERRYMNGREASYREAINVETKNAK